VYKISGIEQVEHEQVVAARVNQLSLFYRVNANLDSTVSPYKNNLYPDIIVMDKQNNVLFIEHVETESSVTKSARNECWVRYSKLGYPFHLIVPKSKIAKAEQLLSGLNINRLYYYIPARIDFRFRKVL
jgi:hypothetical protein